MQINTRFDLNIVRWGTNPYSYHILDDDQCDNFLNGAAAGTYCGQIDTSQLIGPVEADKLYIGDTPINNTIILKRLTQEEIDNFKKIQQMDYHDDFGDIIRIDGDFTIEQLIKMTLYYLEKK